MKFTLVVAQNAIRKLFREKWQLAMFLLIPVIMGGLFSLISGGGSQPKPVGTLLITDNDDSVLSQFIVGGFSQGPMEEMFISKKVTADEAERIMQDGKASVWLEIEKGFGQNFLDEKPTTIKLMKNPSQNILPEIAETAVNVMVDGSFYLQVLFAKELRQFTDLLEGKDISDAQMAAMSVQIKKTIESLEQQLFPPQIKAIKLKKEDNEKKLEKSFLSYMFPGLLFMSLLFASQAMALEFWKDKTQGISSRLLSSPAGLNHYLNGKLLASLFVFALIALVIGSLGLLLLKLSLSMLSVVLLWLMLSGLVLTSMMLFICLLMPSEKSASVVTSAMVFPLMMLGGSFFPFEAMPKWMVAIGQYLPNGYLLQSFNHWFLEDFPLNSLLTPALIAGLFIAVLWWFNQSLFKRFARS